MVRSFGKGPLILFLWMALCSDAEPKCNFNAAMTPKGLEVKIFNGSADATYTVQIRETNGTGITTKEVIKESLTIPFDQLKPCTRYTVEVKNCKVSGIYTFDTPNDVEGLSHFVKYQNDTQVYYKDGKWNLTKSVKIINEKACKTVPLNVTLETCNYTMRATLLPGKPKISYNKTIPTRFIWSNKPHDCHDTHMQVKCTGGAWSHNFTLDQDVSFLPNKTYECKGEYSYENITIKSEEIHVNITCDWQNDKFKPFQDITSKSFVMSWKSLNNKNCPGIKFDYYEARCRSKDKSWTSCTQNNGTACSFHQLKAFTKYTCEIRAKVDTSNISDKNDTRHYIIFTGTQKTLPDQPEFNVTIKTEVQPTSKI